MVHVSRGVTLTELLVAIIIIAILSVTVALNMTNVIGGANEAQLKDMASNLSTMLTTALVQQPTDGDGAPDLINFTPVGDWNNNDAPDPTNFEKFLKPGDLDKCMLARANFGFIAASKVDNTWLNVVGLWEKHPTGVVANFKRPLGLEVPEKVFLINDANFIGYGDASEKFSGHLPYWTTDGDQTP
mgnify:CR=1 FL=1